MGSIRGAVWRNAPARRKKKQSGVPTPTTPRKRRKKCGSDKSPEWKAEHRARRRDEKDNKKLVAYIETMPD